MQSIYKSWLTHISFSLYLFYSSLLIGWQIVSFLFFYQDINQNEIIIRLNHWTVFQPYIIGPGIILTILFIIFKSIRNIKNSEFSRRLKKQIYLNSGFLGILLLDIVLYNAEISIHALRLVTFFISLWMLNRWGNFLSKSEIPAWQHPTTYGAFVVAALLNGCALLGLLNIIDFKNSTVLYYILVLLLFDLFIIYARFRFLSKSNQVLNKIARDLFGSQLIQFGMRIIIGIFMPLIFILYSLLINAEGNEGIGVLILTGTFLDRYLFVISGIGYYTGDKNTG